MQARRDAIIFGVSFIALSAVLGWLFANSTGPVGYYLDVSMLAVPVMSAMLASVGFGWRRKLTYSSITLGLYMLSGVVAELAGLHELARQQLTATDSFPSVWVVLYMTWLTTFPFLMMILFVGKKPSLMWRASVE